MYALMKKILQIYLMTWRRYLCAIPLLYGAVAGASSVPLVAVPLLPVELSTLVTAAIRNHPVVQGAQAQQRAALQDVAVA